MFGRLIAAMVFLSFNSGCYVLNQAYHQNNLINSRRAVEEVLVDPETTPSTRSSLAFIQSVIAYAESQGLRGDHVYRYYVEVNQPVISFIVQAAYTDRMEFKTWWFPIVGSVPYRGYFTKEDRDAMAAELRQDGLDVAEGGASAFSSLGWFEDPIYSSMINTSQPDLAHLFFHELTHRTLWVPGSALFNENLAEYSAEVLTRVYLEKLGKREAVKRYEKARTEKKRFKIWLGDLKNTLTKLYKNVSHQPKAAILNRKQQIFADFLSDQRWPKSDDKNLAHLRKKTWNNATILGASLYSPETERFAKAHACLGSVSVGKFLIALNEAADKFEDQFKALDSLCS